MPASVNPRGDVAPAALSAPVIRSPQPGPRRQLISSFADAPAGAMISDGLSRAVASFSHYRLPSELRRFDHDGWVSIATRSGNPEAAMSCSPKWGTDLKKGIESMSVTSVDVRLSPAGLLAKNFTSS